ncbi:hypothetical protein B0T22DRAFT_536924 [Podospora appendiculata]|uniref:Uncharacterized protein n=1 Tax=Podospora appendiculata TaxID=314037 RepID=A0AAE1C6V3_9PEZI|nr:hypothetical protein B0T22DRAFT_540627 [Podospora appendiculata]KAK3690178.1 hypothetical protein B0T22DRAFT_536924 [Podospora appendiculata]
MSSDAAADYARLAPFGFESVGDTTVNLQIILDCLTSLRADGLVALASSQGVTDPTKSPLTLLSTASTNVSTLSRLPIDAFRAVSSYAKVATTVLPTVTDATELSNTLETAAGRFPAIDVTQAQTVSKTAIDAISTASDPIGTAWSKAKILKRFFKAPSGDLKTAVLLSTVADFVKPIAGEVDITTADGQNKILSLTGLVISQKNLSKSFVDINASDPTEATKIVKSWTTFEGKLATATSSFNQASFCIETYGRALTNVVTAMTNVAAGIAQFRRSIGQAAPDTWQKSLQDVVATWNIIDGNLQAYITLVTQGPTAALAAFRTAAAPAPHMLSMMAANAASEPETPTPADVRDNFGPPSYVDTLLADLGPKAGKINEALGDFLALPYVNALKVTTKQGEETDLRSQVLAIREKYLSLQARSIPILRDINAYALVSEALLPRVNQPGGVQLDTFLEQNVILVMRHGQKAKAIAAETRVLQQEFQDILDTLQGNLKDVLKQIEDQESALEEAEKEYKFEWISAVIEGIITLAFAAGAVAALLLGAAPLAGHLAIHAGVAAYEMIKSAIKASGLATIISNLRKSIEAAKETQKQLETIIPIFTSIINMMEQIGDAWDLITASLGRVQDVYQVWANPKLFTQPYIQETLDAWASVRRGVQSYIDVIIGAPTTVDPGKDSGGANNTPTALVKANTALFFSLSAAAPAANGHHPSRKRSHSLNAKDSKLALMTIMAVNSSDEINSFFSAPTLRGRPISPGDLEALAAGWQRIAANLRSVAQDPLAADCETVATAITTRTVPATQRAVATLLDFARKQPQVPTLPVSEADWQAFYDSRVQALAIGRTTTEFVDAGLRDVQNQARNVYDFSRARVMELRDQIAEYERQLADLQRQRDEKNNLLSQLLGGLFGGGGLFGVAAPRGISSLGFGFPGIPGLPSIPGIPGIPGIPIPGFPGGGANPVDVLRQAIDAINNAINGVTSSKVDATNVMQAVEHTLSVVEQSQNDLGGLARLSSDVALFWADMTTQTTTAADLWQPLHMMQSLEIDLYKTTWAAIVTSFSAWNVYTNNANFTADIV